MRSVLLAVISMSVAANRPVGHDWRDEPVDATEGVHESFVDPCVDCVTMVGLDFKLNSVFHASPFRFGRWQRPYSEGAISRYRQSALASWICLGVLHST